MSKKIKLTITAFIAIITTLLLANSVNAFSPNNQTPIYPQNQGGHWYFCMEKGGPVRFTQFSPNYTEKTAVNRISERSWEALQRQINETLKMAIGRKLQELADYAKPIPSNSTQLKDYNGNFTSDDGVNLDSLLGAKVALTPVMNPDGAPVTRENDRTAYTISSGADVSPIAQGCKQGNYVEA